MKSVVFLLVFLFTGNVLAGEVTVVDAKVSKNFFGSYSFEVTLRHDDKGWEHYADKWEVLTVDGTVLGTRKLGHPHDHEQPFTRTLGGIGIPDGIKEVVTRGHDKVHKFGGKELKIKLPGR